MHTGAGSYRPAHLCFFHLAGFYRSFKAAFTFKGLGSGVGGPLRSTILLLASVCLQHASVRPFVWPNPAFCAQKWSTHALLWSWSPSARHRSPLRRNSARLHMRCPVCALQVRTKGFRESEQLFVSWAKPCGGKPVTKQKALPLDCGSDR